MSDAADATLDRHRAAIRQRLRTSGISRSGPGSISWTVNREVIVIAGWGRAILLQLAHPLVAAGVSDHSRFRGSLGSGLARLRSTVGAMRSLTFGDDDEAISAAARINAIHDRVSGTLTTAVGEFPAGEPYSAHQAELLRWVHATLVDSIPRAYELLVGPLTEEERERYCAEATVMEPLLDIPRGRLPRTVADLDVYVGDVVRRPTLAITERSRALAHAVLFPRGWRWLWPAFRPAQLITIGLLPPSVRDAYGFQWTDRDTRALARWAATLKWLRRITPTFVREWPSSRRTRRPVMELRAASLLIQLINQRLGKSGIKPGEAPATSGKKS